MIIYLSPSNQTNNLYNDGRNECDVCFDTATILQENLRSIGITCYVASKNSTLAQRVKESDMLHADYHIPIHTNAGGGNGTRIFVYPTNTQNKLALAILQSVGEWSVGSVDRLEGNKTLFEIIQPKAKTIYIEGEFHDTNGNHINPNEYANAIYNGIVNGLGITAEKKNETSNKISDVLYGKNYHVLVGRYKTRDDAEKFCKELRANKYEAYVEYY